MILDPKDILIYVNDYFSVSNDVVFKRTRHRSTIVPRQIFFFFCKKYTRLSLAAIGRLPLEFDGKKIYDHATVIHCCKTVTNLVDTNDREFKKAVEHIDKNIVKHWEESQNLGSVCPNSVDLLLIAKKNTELASNYI